MVLDVITVRSAPTARDLHGPSTAIAAALSPAVFIAAVIATATCYCCYCCYCIAAAIAVVNAAAAADFVAVLLRAHEYTDECLFAHPRTLFRGFSRHHEPLRYSPLIVPKQLLKQYSSAMFISRIMLG